MDRTFGGLKQTKCIRNPDHILYLSNDVVLRVVLIFNYKNINKLSKPNRFEGTGTTWKEYW